MDVTLSWPSIQLPFFDGSHSPSSISKLTIGIHYMVLNSSSWIEWVVWLSNLFDKLTSSPWYPLTIREIIDGVGSYLMTATLHSYGFCMGILFFFESLTSNFSISRNHFTRINFIQYHSQIQIENNIKYVLLKLFTIGGWEWDTKGVQMTTQEI